MQHATDSAPQYSVRKGVNMQWYRTRTLCPCVVALLASHCAATPRGGGGPWPGSNVDTMSTPGSGATVNNVKRKVAMLQLDRSERSLQVREANLKTSFYSLLATVLRTPHT